MQTFVPVMRTLEMPFGWESTRGTLGFWGSVVVVEPTEMPLMSIISQVTEGVSCVKEMITSVGTSRGQTFCR